jgi:hypothetical protein
MPSEQIKQLPYGMADFQRIQRGGMYYVDKTHYIPLLEAGPRYLFLIRPRRFGKSLWLSVLENYYDVGFQDRFAATFRNTHIGAHPTPERNSYLVLMFNFATVNPDVRFVENSFEENGKAAIRDFLRRYAPFFTERESSAVVAHVRTEDQLREIFYFAAAKEQKIYLLIDEYDNFANTILTTAGEQAYQELTHGAGFFRYFFNLLKGATAGRMGGLERLFITGVSPVTMDDVTSGFNIGKNLSLDLQFNELLGFTPTEVQLMVDYYRSAGRLRLDPDFCLETMTAWYGGYRFSGEAAERMFNPDMVLHFLLEAAGRTTLPQQMIDQNVRVDYGKLRHLVLVDRRFNGNFSILREIIETGAVTSDVVSSFPVEQLLARENFVSLLFYLGLVTLDGVSEGLPVLRIPNLTIRKLMYGYLRDAFRDVDVFRVDLWGFANLVGRMAYDGEWQAVVDFLAAAVQQQTSVRDYLTGEKVIQGFLLAYLNVTDYFLAWTERELGKGFVDIYLEPFLARFPDMQHGYLLELKYLPRGELTEAKLTAAVQEAEAQLARYAADARVQKVVGRVTITPVVLVYHGWELVYRGEAGRVRDAGHRVSGAS